MNIFTHILFTYFILNINTSFYVKLYVSPQHKDNNVLSQHMNMRKILDQHIFTKKEEDKTFQNISELLISNSGNYVLQNIIVIDD